VSIQYEVREPLPVSVKIYNTRGQMVQSFELGVIEIGSHNLNWQAENLPAGVYMIQMKAGDIISRSKAVLSK
jgi:flagellar hook assembly protein FlgD